MSKIVKMFIVTLIAMTLFERQATERTTHFECEVKELTVTEETEYILFDRMETANFDRSVTTAENELVCRNAARASCCTRFTVEAMSHNGVKRTGDREFAIEDSLHQGDLTASNGVLFAGFSIDRADCLAVAAFHTIG